MAPFHVDPSGPPSRKEPPRQSFRHSLLSSCHGLSAGTKKSSRNVRSRLLLHLSLLDIAGKMGKQLIVFDFDWSFVDQDTDRWVFEVLSTELRRLLQERKKGQGTGIQCTPDVV